MTTVNEIPTGLGGRHIYFRYNATSACVGDNVVQPGDIENMDVGVEILFLAVLCAEILLLSVWAAAITVSGITRLPAIIVDNTIEQLENMDIAIGILLLCALELEI